MAADSLPSSNSKTQSSGSCLCSGSNHEGSSRSSSSASDRCSHCSFRPRSPPLGRPASGGRDRNALGHFHLSNSATGVANGSDPLGDELGAQWEDSKKLNHQLPHHMPKLPNMN
ncbi:uncharacterized protein BKA55DRAFT_691109 [Fusarium redolens]|uniref:Uncharacterized protein n=1 Tax=Fusarium redolens TaxID=48865 RepID=A0A9P9KDH5_FUSRE|nr:uncharacterized protein BKA55DRAFT_691109 [Fusarium redolens]KAH7248999.1 hypothetical protein BKA55DRAFT_691109 [Fusarium redolens]